MSTLSIGKYAKKTKFKALIAQGYSSDFNGEAYHTVAGQNSNNSVRINDEFMHAVLEDKEWETRYRTTGEICETHKARDLFNQICEAAWSCADPGVQFDTTINDWHTCAATDRIYGSNPCSEYMFLDDSACNLASLNLLKYTDEQGNFDIELYKHATRVFITAMEIFVDFASYPTARIARNSHDYRPLGLGYANLGAMLMVNGIPYDSKQGQAICGGVTSILSGEGYATSAEIAASKGAFPGFDKNRYSMMRVMNKHRSACDDIPRDDVAHDLIEAAAASWDRAIEIGEKHGYRNAQISVLAPTGTIGLLMDCDTTGVEPDFAIVKFKKLAGGGYFKIVNQSVPLALKRLGYSESQVDAILDYTLGTMRFDEDGEFVAINKQTLLDKGMDIASLTEIESKLPQSFELSQAFTRWNLSDETLQRLGVSVATYEAPDFNLLTYYGFSQEEIARANKRICGTMTVEGAPHLKEEHLAVFDCANKCGSIGERFIEPMGHVRMMAASQPFISGAISKTINLPTEATVDDIYDLYFQSWKLGLKAVALYRDGCKSSQPLSNKTEDKEAVSEAASPQAIPQPLRPPVAKKGAAASPKKRRWLDTKCTCVPVNMKMVRSVKSLSTCTKRALLLEAYSTVLPYRFRLDCSTACH